MGNLCARNKKQQNKIDILEHQIAESRKIATELNSAIFNLKVANKKLARDKLSSDSQCNELRTRLSYIKDVLGESSHIADSILGSDLNCEWIDDAKEKIYLISIINFLYEVCIASQDASSLTARNISPTTSSGSSSDDNLSPMQTTTSDN
jgi:hypothetical protein